MPLAAGTRLSFYEILGPIGAGAMGEVWRAKDTRLDREVAIKVLPEHFASDEERLRRFEREAKTLAALNHPNVAQIFGVDQIADTCFLVLELVPGESLEERLKRGPLPLEEAIDVGRQIAEGLEAAHEAGVIHRDLKPANVRITPDGKVKVLDFGLAKPAREGHDGSSTDSVLATEKGRLLGTPTYMSPEQARGKLIDKRVDVWAFGCVLYECLTGKRAFAGETLTDVFVSVLEREPDLASLPPALPPRIRELLARCLEKDPRERLRDLGEARVLLADPSILSVATAAAARSRAWPIVAVVVAAALVGAASDRFLSKSSAPPAPTRSQGFELQGAHSYGPSRIAISPDGQWLAYAEIPSAKLPITLRRLGTFESRTIPGSEGSLSPFFSPDSGSIAFFTGKRGLCRVSLEGGTGLQTITADADFGHGAWSGDGTIVFVGGRREGTRWQGLLRVNSAGGSPEVVTTIDPAKGERQHVWPSFTPDGRTVLFSTELEDRFRIEAIHLSNGERRILVDPATAPRCLPTGHLAYGNLEHKELLIAPFDVETLSLRGPAIPAVSGIAELTSGGMAYDFSEDGTLVYDPAGVAQEDSEVVWFDRNGTSTPIDSFPDGRWDQPRLSPDGKRLLIRKSGSPACALWMHDLERGVSTRVELGADCHDPLWSVDGTEIFCDVAGTARPGVCRATPGSAAPAETLAQAPEHKLMPWSRTPDGKILALMSNEDASTAPDIDLLEIEGGAKRSFLKTKAGERFPAFSPDGRYLAYASDETGESEVYLRSFPVAGEFVRVSTAGGTSPVWARDGSELFYTLGRRMMSVTVATSPALRVGTPAALFETSAVSPLAGRFDVTADGKRFVATVSKHGLGHVPHVRIVLNWFEDVRRLGADGNRR